MLVREQKDEKESAREEQSQQWVPMLPHSIFPKQLTLIVNNPLYKTGCCENHSTTYTGDMQTPLPTACEVAV